VPGQPMVLGDAGRRSSTDIPQGEAFGSPREREESNIGAWATRNELEVRRTVQARMVPRRNGSCTLNLKFHFEFNHRGPSLPDKSTSSFEAQIRATYRPIQGEAAPSIRLERWSAGLAAISRSASPC